LDQERLNIIITYHEKITMTFSNFCTPSFLGDSFAIKIPGISNHKFEILIVIDTGRDIVVVFDPLLHGNFSISCISIA